LSAGAQAFDCSLKPEPGKSFSQYFFDFFVRAISAIWDFASAFFERKLLMRWSYCLMTNTTAKLMTNSSMVGLDL
jgi:hypothetical protein